MYKWPIKTCHTRRFWSWEAATWVGTVNQSLNWARKAYPWWEVLHGYQGLRRVRDFVEVAPHGASEPKQGERPPVWKENMGVRAEGRKQP